MGMAQGENVRRDVRYRIGRWLGSTTPRGIFGVLLLASVGFPIATWLEWLQGSLGEPLGVEIFMFLAWLLCAALAYAWWFFARLGATEPDRADPPASADAAQTRPGTRLRRRRRQRAPSRGRAAQSANMPRGLGLVGGSAGFASRPPRVSRAASARRRARPADSAPIGRSDRPAAPGSAPLPSALHRTWPPGAGRTAGSGVSSSSERIVSGVPIGISAASRRIAAVSEPDASVRHATRDELWLARAVDADESTRGPVGEHGGAGARPERDRPVERVAVPGQLVPHVEAALRGRGCGRPDADRRAEDRPPVTQEHRPPVAQVDDQVGVGRRRSLRARIAAPSRSCRWEGREGGPAPTASRRPPACSRGRGRGSSCPRESGRRPARQGGSVPPPPTGPRPFSAAATRSTRRGTRTARRAPGSRGPARAARPGRRSPVRPRPRGRVPGCRRPRRRRRRRRWRRPQPGRGRRDRDPRAAAQPHPVKRGLLAAFVRGRARQRSRCPGRGGGSPPSIDVSSNGSAAGCSPAMYRIHAACRASTEWMPTAAASTSRRLDLVGLALVGGRARDPRRRPPSGRSSAGSR